MQYDAWGNLVSRRSGLYEQHYAWDAENRLISAQGTGPEGRFQAHYQYDALGRRTRKQVATAHGTTETRFLWQGYRLLQEQHEGGQCSTYLYDPNEAWSPLARIDHLRDDWRGEIYWFSTDLNGAPLEVTDQRGNVRWSGHYGSFGEVRHQTAGFTGALQHTALAHQPLRYAGQYADSETGLHYNLFRYYDPQVGRFIVQDPIGLSGGWNLYQYAPNPLGWIDPLGLCKGDIARGDNPYQTRVDSRFRGRPDPAFSIDSRTFESGISTSNGGIRNNQEFWKQWANLQPNSLSNNNLYRIQELGLSPKIDDTWIKLFPEHMNYKGDTIIHHHIDFGPYAMPVPGSTHVGSGGVWHTK